MLVHLATFNDPHLDQPAAAFHLHASTDRVGAHQLTDSPELADIILFTHCQMLTSDWRLARIRRHRLTREFREKVMVYNECDRPWCALPGVYVNMPGPRFVSVHQRPWAYFVPVQATIDESPDLLFSFVGSDTAACRRPLFALRHQDAVVEEAREFKFWDATSDGFEKHRTRFRSTLARSFALRALSPRRRHLLDQAVRGARRGRRTGDHRRRLGPPGGAGMGGMQHPMARGADRRADADAGGPQRRLAAFERGSATSARGVLLARRVLPSRRRALCRSPALRVDGPVPRQRCH